MPHHHELKLGNPWQTWKSANDCSRLVAYRQAFALHAAGLALGSRDDPGLVSRGALKPPGCGAGQARTPAGRCGGRIPRYCRQRCRRRNPFWCRDQRPLGGHQPAAATGCHRGHACTKRSSTSRAGLGGREHPRGSCCRSGGSIRRCRRTPPTQKRLASITGDEPAGRAGCGHAPAASSGHSPAVSSPRRPTACALPGSGRSS